MTRQQEGDEAVKQTVDPFGIPCPDCKVKAGQRCMDGWVGIYQFTHHNMRIDAASKLPVQPEDETTLRATVVGIIEPLSLNQITPEIRLLASRCILASDDTGGAFSRDAHKYAAYTIIRERQLLAALAERDALKINLEREKAANEHYRTIMYNLQNDSSTLRCQLDALKAENEELKSATSMKNTFWGQYNVQKERADSLQSQLDAVAGQETAYRKVLESVRDDDSGRDHFRHCKTGVFYPGLTAPQDDRCSICEKIDTLLDTPPLKAGQ